MQRDKALPVTAFLLQESPIVRYVYAPDSRFGTPIVITFVPGGDDPTQAFALGIGYAMDLRDALNEIIEAHKTLNRYAEDDETPKIAQYTSPNISSAKRK